MQERKGYSLDTVRQANMMMMLGIKPEHRISDKFSREDIERAFREASIKVFGGSKKDNDRKQAELGTVRVPEELVNEFVEAQSDYTSSYGNEIAKEKERIAQDYREKYEKLADAVKPSFWYGVLQGIVASFLFVLAGYIILKMNGSWDILLSNLFK